MNIKMIGGAALLLAASTAQAATMSVSYEAAGATNTTATFDYYGVETFDGKAGQTDFTSSFTYDGNTIELTYKDVKVIGANQYGGDGGSDYAVAGLGYGTLSYSIDITQSGSTGVNYFGYWLSALDAGNTVKFYSGGSEVFSFAPVNVLALVSGQPDYWGHPVTGQNSGEPYVFLNFFYDGGTFDRIEFIQAPGGAGYESDNHTVGFFKDKGDGTPVTDVPEPGALGLLGLGLALAAVARRRKA
ncbi:MAG: PEP-CTERM sorting domain-containing protein [Sphingosinicella sp.]|nr:PEP-CTERM sorting domain-containing protein [Sphingosinicella sp.]